MSCIFCKIINREIPSEILFENEQALSILDINPIHYGHALIIPKRHSKNFLDVHKDDLQGIMEATHTVANALVKELNLEAFNFFSNNGEIAGQSVFHFHIHVTPRYADDNIKFVLQLKKYEGDLQKEFAKRIRTSIISLQK
ncbi:MAG: HIT family protein [Bacteroidota bacterium]